MFGIDWLKKNEGSVAQEGPNVTPVGKYLGGVRNAARNSPDEPQSETYLPPSQNVDIPVAPPLRPIGLPEDQIRPVGG